MMNVTIQRQGEVKTDQLGIAILPAKKKIEHIRPVLREDSSSIITNIYPYGTSRSGQEKETVGFVTLYGTGASTGRGKTYSSKGSLM